MKENPTKKRTKKKESIPAGADDTLKEMVSALNELPTDVLAMTSPRPRTSAVFCVAMFNCAIIWFFS